MRFDLIDHQFDFPTLMIQLDQRERWRHARVEQRRYQAIHLAWLSQARIGHPIGDDAHPHAALQGIASMSRMGWFHPSQHRAISQAALLAQVLPCACFQGSQDMGATLTNLLDEAARDEAFIYQHHHVGSDLREQAVRPKAAVLAAVSGVVNSVPSMAMSR